MPIDSEPKSAEAIAAAKFNAVTAERRAEKLAATEAPEAALIFQEHEPFEDFAKHIDQDGNRLPPSPEVREQMNKSLIALGQLFAGTGLHWQLDGAINISLMKGDYIGKHKDVDISIEANEIVLAEQKLAERGYGLFLSYSPTPDAPQNKKVLERVSAADFLAAAESDKFDKHPIIAAINAAGTIRKDTNLNFIDAHLMRRVAGEPVGYHGVQLPGKWFEPFPIAVQGTEVMLSHPAKVAYFKLHGERNYDATDLKLLAESGRLTQFDIDEITDVYKAEQQARLNQGAILFDGAFTKLQSGLNQEQIKQALLADINLGHLIARSPVELDELAGIMASTGKLAFAELQADIIRIFKLDIQLTKERANLTELRGWVESAAVHP